MAGNQLGDTARSGDQALPLKFLGVSTALSEPQHSRHGFTVADRSSHNPVQDLRKGYKGARDALINLGLGNAGTDATGKEHGHGFLKEAGAGVEEKHF